MSRWTRNEFSDAARRHGISDERARHVVRSAACEAIVPAADDPEWLLYLGFDESGVALEVIGVDAGEGCSS